jgi:hypothetical protein
MGDREQIAREIAALRERCRGKYTTRHHVALTLVADMEFALGEGWGNDGPTLDSRYRPRENPSFGSAINLARALIEDATE